MHSLWSLIIKIGFIPFEPLAIEISPGRLPLCILHRADLPGLNTLYMHFSPITHWYYITNKINLLHI